MAEERRKKQEDRDHGASTAKTKTGLIYGFILVLLAGAYLGGQYHRNHKYDAFAKCLAAKQVKMYGLSWCSHCVDQKHMFGAAFHYVPYVECGIAASKEETPECKAAGLNLFPTWQFGIEPPKAGVLSLEALSEKTGCGLP
jgi:hypothetical protein